MITLKYSTVRRRTLRPITIHAVLRVRVVGASNILKNFRQASMMDREFGVEAVKAAAIGIAPFSVY